MENSLNITEEQKAENSKSRILLIEDELFINDLYKRILIQAGFQVESAYDGEQALEIAKTKPNLILLDIMIPKLNGIEVLQRLKADLNTKSIPVVMLTNLGQAEIVKQAFGLGAQGYFLKMKLSLQQLISESEDFIRDPQKQMDLNSLDLES